MAFSSSFGVQVAAIMDVLAKAAVAEITKLVEDGMVSLRLEMCRKDSELQELKVTLKSMEAEICKAQEAATSRATAEEQHVPRKDEKDDPERPVLYPEPNPADSLCEPVVKHEPEEQPAPKETAANIAAAAAAVTAAAASTTCLEAGEQDNLLWPPRACGMFEKTSVEAVCAMQQQIQMFSSRPEQYAAHRNADNSYNSSSAAAEDIAGDSLSLPIKVEVEMRPPCMGGVASESAHNDQFRCLSQPVAGQDQCLQSTSRQAGPSLAPPHMQRPAPGMLGSGANNLRAKRLLNMWRANPKLFICSVCNKGFPRLSQLEEHKATHEPFKPFRCLECGKSFTQKTRLKTHQSVHTGERPFGCKICGKRFSRQDNCLRHERFHSGVKPYSCGQCSKSFTVLGNLKMHLETHLHGR